MNDINVKLTVFFENPFWVGVFEHVENNFLIVSKVTFGAEPKGYEVLDYIIKNYYSLVFSPAVETKIKKADASIRYRNKIAACIKIAT